MWSFGLKKHYYSNIDDCPVGVYYKILESKDLRLLHLKGFYTSFRAKLAWKQIEAELIKTYGLPTILQEYYRKKVSALHFYDLAYNKDKSYLTNAKVLDKQADMMLQEEVGEVEKFEVMVGKVSKLMGFRIDVNIISIREFNGYLEAIKSEQNGK